MTSKEMKNIGQTQILEKRSIRNATTNNIKSYSLKKITIEKNIKTDIGDSKNSQNSQIYNKTLKYKSKSNDKLPIIKSQSQNNSFYLSKDIKPYEFNSGIANTSNCINLKHHPNQINNIINNHMHYNSKTLKDTKEAKRMKTSNLITSKSTEKIGRINKKYILDNNKYVVESKRFEYYGNPRYSSASNSSRETNISISKTQLKKLMANMWLENIYCSNVESLSCIIEKNNQNNKNYLEENNEQEFEKYNKIIKEYESQIIKLKSVLNIKEQELKTLAQNLKHAENTLKIKNKQIYELNIKKGIKRVVLDKDSHELQIISTKQKSTNENIYNKNSLSVQIIKEEKNWNKISIPSPVNEIFIETVKHESPKKNKKFEEMRRLMIRKEEEEKIYKKKLEDISKFEIQEMGLLSILAKKPKKYNLCQHLQSLMILSKPKKSPITFQKIEEIIITSQPNKKGNKIQKLNGLEIINIKKKKLILQQQCLNGLEIKREYDMFLFKPSWDSLKIQGSGLNLISLKKEIELENQEIDEFQISGEQKPKIIIEKNGEVNILGKAKNIEYKINKERIKLLGSPTKKEKNWNEINKPIKSNKLIIKNEYEKIEPKIEINWNDIIKPIKTTKLFVKKLVPKENIFIIAKKDKFNFLYSSPTKNKEEYDIENFNINLINSDKKMKQIYKITNNRIDIKGKEKKNILLIKNRIDSINIFGLIKKSNLIPSVERQMELFSKINSKKEWNLINKIIKTKNLNILKKNKEPNKISKKEINIEIKTTKKCIFKPIKEIKLLIQPMKKINEMPKIKKEAKLFIKGLVKEEKGTVNWNDLNKLKREYSVKIKGNDKINWNNLNKLRKENSIKLINETKKRDWNDINKSKKEHSIKLIGNKIKKNIWIEKIKIDKKQILNILHKPKLCNLKKQNNITINFKGKKAIENNKIEIINNKKNSIKPQRSIKLNIKGKIKQMYLKVSKGDKFMIKREPEEEIIFNDDYNYLTRESKINDKEKNIKEKNEKMLVIKEKEITPIMRRQIRAEVIKIKDDISETSEQSDVDVLEGIQMRRTIAYSSGRLSSSSGYRKNILNGEVIFTPKINFGVNIINSKNMIIENEKTFRRSFQNINENKILVINKGYNISTSKCNTLYKSPNNINNSNKLSKIPNDSRKRNIRKQIIIKSKINEKTINGAINDENINMNQTVNNDNLSKTKKNIIFNTHLSKKQIKHSASKVEIRNRKKKLISIQNK